MLGSVGTVQPTRFCCAVTFILLSACLVAYTKLVMFARATFFCGKSLCLCWKKVGHLCWCLTRGPCVWRSVTVERSKVYFWTSASSFINFVCSMNLVTFTGLKGEISICLSPPSWGGYISLWYRTTPSMIHCSDWCTVMNCDTSYLVVILIIYMHLCWMWKLGCCALLCNKSVILLE